MGDIINAGADLLGFGPASKAADAQRDAANIGSAAQLQAARLAAEAARFRPVGVTTGFGSSQFTTDAEGNLTGAGYTLTPELQAIRNRLIAQAGTYDPSQALEQARALGTGAGSLFQAGQGYLSASPEEARQRYISQQQALLNPLNEQNLAGIRNRLFQTGRTGLATGGTSSGNMAQTNPELAAYYNSLAQQQNQLAAGSEAASQQQQTFGTGMLGAGADLLGRQAGLYSQAYAPVSTLLGLGSTIEGLGQQALGLGSELGGRASTAGANAGRYLLAGGLGSAQALQGAAGLQGMARASGMAGLLNNPALSSSNPQVKNWFNNIIGGGSTGPTPADFGYNPYQPDFGGFDASSTSTPGLWQDASYD
jgi:hypothetical protein